MGTYAYREPAIEWTSLRVQKSTREALEAIRQTLLTARENDQYQVQMRHTVCITVDDVIRELIRRDQSHRERAKRSRKGKGRAKGTSRADRE